MTQVSKSVTINRSVSDVYQFWRDLANLPRFMAHVESVTVAGGSRSHWVVKGPAGKNVEWDAEIVEERPGELIAWRSLPGGTITNGGSVRFTQAPADRGTEIHVQLEYEAAAGKAGELIATLFGEEPKQQLTDDLRRLKQVLETGEVVRSDGSLEGAGQGVTKQRPSQPPTAQELEVTR
jgi:uncharacterized membrane protein